MEAEVHPAYRDYVVTTKLHRVLWEGSEIWLKDETEQPSGSFKFRGSINFLLGRSERAFVTASTGNHGAGLAHAGQLVGVGVKVVVPVTTPQVKMRRVLDAGADLLVAGDEYEESHRVALDLVDQCGSVYVPSFDDPDIIRGHSEIFLEVAPLVGPPLDAVFVPVGGGGLLASAIEAGIAPVVGVELASAPAMHNSLRQGKPVAVSVENTPGVEGLEVRRVGTIPFQTALRGGSPIVLVEVEELYAAMRWCWKLAGVRVECAGAASVAGLLRTLAESPEATRPRRVLCVLSGGNVERATWGKAMNA